MDVRWVSDAAFVAAGHDCAPFMFQTSPGSINAGTSLDVKGTKGPAASSNMAQWQNRDKLGAADGAKDQGIDTLHQNCITNIQTFAGNATSVSQISTSGLDGGVCVWKV